ncbi:MFS transporter [Pseudorhodoferax sp. LjRoot39]|uniref:MFS transporter n=1 Tax=Pseudorhodoferax sp. LjRoot39 TaxID=3342328 RepID=UPI003ED04A97
MPTTTLAPVTSHSRFALAGLATAMLLSALGAGIANVGLPALAQAFGAPFQQVQWVVLAYLLAVTALVLPAGRLGDWWGRRNVLLGGIALFGMASGLGALAPTLGWLVAARAVQGAGAACLMALTLALVAQAAPRTRVGSAMGLLGTVSALGTALGPALGGVLLAGFGWRALFWAPLPLAAVALVLVGRLPVERGAAVPARPASLGPWRGAPGLASGLAVSLLVSCVVMATLVVGPFHLAGALGLDAARIGLAMACGPLVAALVGLPAGRLVDQWGAGRMLRAGLAAMAAGCSVLALAPLAWGVLGYVLPLVLMTAGYALVQAANNTAVMAGAAAERRGQVSGLLGLSRNLGLVAGASLMGAVFLLGSGVADPAVASPQAVAAGTRAAFALATLLALAAGFVSRAATTGTA